MKPNEKFKSLYRRPSLSDGISAVNQTNLALKGIIGIKSMAEISLAVGQSNDSDYFQVRFVIDCGIC